MNPKSQQSNRQKTGLNLDQSSDRYKDLRVTTFQLDKSNFKGQVISPESLAKMIVRNKNQPGSKQSHRRTELS